MEVLGELRKQKRKEPFSPSAHRACAGASGPLYTSRLFSPRLASSPLCHRGPAPGEIRLPGCPRMEKGFSWKGGQTPEVCRGGSGFPVSLLIIQPCIPTPASPRTPSPSLHLSPLPVSEPTSLQLGVYRPVPLSSFPVGWEEGDQKGKKKQRGREKKSPFKPRPIQEFG